MWSSCLSILYFLPFLSLCRSASRPLFGLLAVHDRSFWYVLVVFVVCPCILPSLLSPSFRSFLPLYLPALDSPLPLPTYPWLNAHRLHWHLTFTASSRQALASFLKINHDIKETTTHIRGGAWQDLARYTSIFQHQRAVAPSGLLRAPQCTPVGKGAYHVYLYF